MRAYPCLVLAGYWVVKFLTKWLINSIHWVVLTSQIILGLLEASSLCYSWCCLSFSLVSAQFWNSCLATRNSITSRKLEEHWRFGNQWGRRPGAAICTLLSGFFLHRHVSFINLYLPHTSGPNSSLYYAQLLLSCYESWQPSNQFCILYNSPSQVIKVRL